MNNYEAKATGVTNVVGRRLVIHSVVNEKTIFGDHRVFEVSDKDTFEDFALFVTAKNPVSRALTRVLRTDGPGVTVRLLHNNDKYTVQVLSVRKNEQK